MQDGWYAANYRSLRLSPPHLRKALHESVLDEILDERVSSSRGRSNPRGVKQKMSNYPIRDRSLPCNKRLDVTEYIEVIGVPIKERATIVPECGQTLLPRLHKDPPVAVDRLFEPYWP
jgi:hypothetical protein